MKGGRWQSRTVEDGPGALRAVALAVHLGVLASYNALQAQCPDGSPPPCRLTSHASTAPAPNSVAVLYFDNLSPDTADAYLADGLTEELIGRLGQLQRLAVKSRAAVQRFREPVGEVCGRGVGGEVVEVQHRDAVKENPRPAPGVSTSRTARWGRAVRALGLETVVRR